MFVCMYVLCTNVYVCMFMYACMFMYVWTLHECIILLFPYFMLLTNSVVKVVFEKSNIAQATNANPIQFLCVLASILKFYDCCKTFCCKTYSATFLECFPKHLIGASLLNSPF
jgi:hypothetical protein